MGLSKQPCVYTEFCHGFWPIKFTYFYYIIVFISHWPQPGWGDYKAPVSLCLHMSIHHILRPTKGDNRYFLLN